MASCVSRRTKQLLCLPNTDGAAVLRLLCGRHCRHGDAAMQRLLCGKDCRHCSTSTAAKPERKVRTRMKAWQIHKYGGRNTILSQSFLFFVLSCVYTITNWLSVWLSYI